MVFFFNRGAIARLAIRTAKFELSVMTALCFINCAFYDMDEDFGLDATLMMHEGILMCLSPAFVADIDDLRLRTIVRRTKFDAATFIVGFKRLQDLACSAMGLVSFFRRLPY